MCILRTEELAFTSDRCSYEYIYCNCISDPQCEKWNHRLEKNWRINYPWCMNNNEKPRKKVNSELAAELITLQSSICKQNFVLDRFQLHGASCMLSTGSVTRTLPTLRAFWFLLQCFLSLVWNFEKKPDLKISKNGNAKGFWVKSMVCYS